MRTRSEELFERFCSENSIPFQVISTVGEEKTPDYELQVARYSIAVEVKQLDTENEPWKEGEVKSGSTTPGDHIRRKINKAGPQLRARAAAGQPSILVIYNNIYRGICIHSEPYDFLVAMYGLQNIVLGVPEVGPPYIKGQRFGPQRKMTDTTNTSFSALAHLREKKDERLFLDVFHNAHAAIPLDPILLTGDNISHFAIPRGSVEFKEWERIR